LKSLEEHFGYSISWAIAREVSFCVTQTAKNGKVPTTRQKRAN
jgi:hypothetical protein